MESPRPVSRRKNKPAPEPPGVSPAPSVKHSSAVKTPEKESDKKTVNVESGPEKPVLPPTGPDSKRLSALPTVEKKPVLAPRPSLNPLIERAATMPSHQPPAAAAPIGFESIENELRRQGSVRQVPPVAGQKTDEEPVEVRKPSAGTHKRFPSLDHANPTPHPNAVSMFGGMPPPPTPLDRTKFDVDKPKPSVPERPSVIKLQGKILPLF